MLVGTPVHDIQDDGSVIAKVQTSDKLRAFLPDNSDKLGKDFKETSKMKVRVGFPPLGRNVVRRTLFVTVNNAGKETSSELWLPRADVFADMLIRKSSGVHCELVAIDTNDVAVSRDVITFCTHTAVTPKPLNGPTPLSIRLLETVGVRVSPGKLDPKYIDSKSINHGKPIKDDKEAVNSTRAAASADAVTHPENHDDLAPLMAKHSSPAIQVNSIIPTTVKPEKTDLKSSTDPTKPTTTDPSTRPSTAKPTTPSTPAKPAGIINHPAPAHPAAPAPAPTTPVPTKTVEPKK
jgi:hypothetical protein